MSGGAKVKTKQHIKSTLLQIKGKTTPADIKKFKKNKKEWSQLKTEAYRIINEQMKDNTVKNKKFINENTQKQISEIIQTKFGIHTENSKKSEEFLKSQPFNSNKFILPKKMLFLNNTTRNYVTHEVLEEIGKQPEGSIIKHAYRMTDGKIYFYTMTPSLNDSSKVITNPPFATIEPKTSTFTSLNVLPNINYAAANQSTVLGNPNYEAGK